MPVSALVTPGPGSHQGNADFAADTGIGICRVYGCLLVANQDVLEFIELEKGIVDFDNRAARIAEYILEHLGFETCTMICAPDNCILTSFIWTSTNRNNPPHHSTCNAIPPSSDLGYAH